MHPFIIELELYQLPLDKINFFKNGLHDDCRIIFAPQSLLHQYIVKKFLFDQFLVE